MSKMHAMTRFQGGGGPGEKPPERFFTKPENYL